MISRTALIIVGYVLIFALYVGLFLSIICTNNDAGNIFVVNPDDIKSDTAVVLDDRNDNLFHFIQISDTHFSKYGQYERSTDLMSFCKTMLPVLDASMLILTGDITDSRVNDPMGSRQFKEEWDTYNETRLSCLKDNPKMAWLDIRGNHDNFNVLGDVNAFYKNYTFQANQTKDAKSYRYEHVTPDGNRYSFIAVDACLHPGIRRPYNFIGRLDKNELDKIQRFKEESSTSNYTMWFGHYPTSAITNARDLRRIINGPYLCGHYHIPQMWSSQPDGYFEVELGDWKSNRFFRINVIDGGLYSFADFNYLPSTINKPMIVITNPRSVLFQMEKYEKFWRTQRSTHVRAVVFSNSEIKRVWACISKNEKDAKANSNCLERLEMKEAKAALYVSEWTSDKYKSGLYYIAVFAENQHSKADQTVPFSLDRTKPNYSVLGRFMTRGSFEIFHLIIYLSTLVFILFHLFLLRFTTGYDRNNLLHYSNLARKNFFRKQFFKFYLVSHINLFFIPFVIIPIYMSIGPWMVARIVEDHYGVVFLWKQFVYGQVLPAAFSYLLASLFLLLIQLPTMYVVGTLIVRRTSERFRNSEISSNNSETDEKNDFQPKLTIVDYLIIVYCVFLFLLASFYCLIYYFSYGIVAFFTSFFTWSTVVYAILIYKAFSFRHIEHID